MHESESACFLCILFSAVQNNKNKQILTEIVNSISFHRCLSNENFVLFFEDTFSPDDVLSKIADLGRFKKNEKGCTRK